MTDLMSTLYDYVLTQSESYLAVYPEYRDFCRRAAELVLETDYKIKTSYDDPERLLELLLLQLAQEGRNG